MSNRSAMQNKSPQMKSIINNLSTSIYGISMEEAVKQEICVQCQQPAMSNIFTDLGMEEYYISGICERCWDRMFGEDEMKGGD